ncbi:UDP-glucose 4-epimerase [Xylophilus ampelinus]|uniref:Transferase family hexapeptide repeat protein n=1 Tax=Xylophilus ampelinus TaxID=54067 RepID=A0A318SDF2_9BURK|nr:UDP-glucose 4-epimerase [Xylophilus ampelinus]MCS4511207.1 UDP-glucose 4-epimerase [Xylophilus ampelinus]PYE75038.1 transferase family hexapeptide repeat protein [Xylophilus ampelinus]
MKKLWLFHTGGDLKQIRHEIVRDAQYEIAGVHLLEKGGDDMPSPPIKALLAQARQDGDACFVIGDARLLNQSRLAAYMAIKAAGGRIIPLKASSASIADGVRLRENVWVDHAARVLPGVSMGANTWIMHNSELGTHCKVGSSCWIGPHCQISERATLGKNCTLGHGTVIGPDVVLPDWSTIGSNVTITHSPHTTLFIDSRFRAPVHIFNS